ncbi:MAG: type II secretion system GspH family protein [Magnetococcus sp. DMHC-6]
MIRSNFPKDLKQRAAGVTLIELIIAITLLAFITGALVTPISTMMANMEQPRKMMQATFLVQEKQEEILYNRRQLTNTQTLAANMTPNSNQTENALAGFTQFGRRVTIDKSYTPGVGNCQSTSAACWNYTVEVFAMSDNSTYSSADLFIQK